MSGKTSIMLVVAFAILISIFNRSAVNYSTETVENVVTYHNSTQAKHAAISGANVGLTKLFIDPNYNSAINKSFHNGNVNVTFATQPNGNIRMTSVGTYESAKDTVIVTLAHLKSFSYYGQFYSTEGTGWWSPGTWYTPYHTAGRLKLTGGKHTFKMPASSEKGIHINNLGFGAPKNTFEMGFKSGVNIPLNFDALPIKTAAQTNGKVFKDAGGQPVNVKLKFKNDGTVNYTWAKSGDPYPPEQNIAVTNLTPNGVILIDRGNVYVEGVLDGKVTVYATRVNNSGGVIYLPNSITYKTHPNTKVNGQYISDDVLGLVADKNLVMMYDPNRTSCQVHAALFLKGGTHEFPNWNLYEPPIGFYVVGGLACTGYKISGQAGWKNGVYQIIRGVGVGISGDKRFYLDNPIVPPFYPTTNELKMLSWYE